MTLAIFKEIHKYEVEDLQDVLPNYRRYIQEINEFSESWRILEDCCRKIRQSAEGLQDSIRLLGIESIYGEYLDTFNEVWGLFSLNVQVNDYLQLASGNRLAKHDLYEAEIRYNRFFTLLDEYREKYKKFIATFDLLLEEKDIYFRNDSRDKWEELKSLSNIFLEKCDEMF